MKDFLVSTIREAGEMAKEYFYRGVTTKIKSHPTDFVSEADTAISDFFVKKIGAKYPDHHIHTEELKKDVNDGAEWEWVIDPIDGTRNFAFGVPLWCVLAAALKDGETILAAAYLPLSDQLFFAEKGKGARLNEKKMPFFPPRAVIPFTPGNFGVVMNSPYFDRYLGAMNAFIRKGGRLGNFQNVTGLLFAATGAIHVAAFNGGYDHDYLAPALIGEEACMKVTDCDGNPWRRGRRDILIANPKLHPKALELFL